MLYHYIQCEGTKSQTKGMRSMKEKIHIKEKDAIILKEKENAPEKKIANTI